MIFISSIQKLYHHFLHLSPMKIILFGYCAIICIGSILLALPISTRNPDAANLFTGFFTATSATCVTGLIQVDTYTHSLSDSDWRNRIHDTLHFDHDTHEAKDWFGIQIIDAELGLCSTNWRNCKNDTLYHNRYVFY